MSPCSYWRTRHVVLSCAVCLASMALSSFGPRKDHHLHGFIVVIHAAVLKPKHTGSRIVPAVQIVHTTESGFSLVPPTSSFYLCTVTCRQVVVVSVVSAELRSHIVWQRITFDHRANRQRFTVYRKPQKCHIVLARWLNYTFSKKTLRFDKSCYPRWRPQNTVILPWQKPTYMLFHHIHSFKTMVFNDVEVYEQHFYRAMHVVLAPHCYRKSSVCPTVTLMYRGHIGWTSSKLITRIISLGSMLFGATTSAI